MRNLLRCRRGSVAFATVIALVPLIGVVALGAEAGSWYVTKQHAQNAADSGSLFGRLAAGVLACSIYVHCRYKIDGLSRQGICGTERVLQHGRHCRLSGLAGVPDFRAEPRRPSIIRAPNGSRTPFRPPLPRRSQHTWQKCLVCPQ